MLDIDIKKTQANYISDKTSVFIDKFLDNENMSFDELIKLMKLGQENNKKVI